MTLSESIKAANDIYEIQSVFESICDEVSTAEVTASAIPALEAAFEFDSSNEDWAYVAWSIAEPVLGRNKMTLASECVSRAVNMVKNQPDDTQFTAANFLFDKATRTKEEDGIEDTSIAQSLAQLLMSVDIDDTWELRNFASLVGLSTIPERHRILTELAERLEKMDLTVAEICELAMNVSDIEGMWNLGDNAWASRLMIKAESQASSAADKSEIKSAKVFLEID